MLVAGGAWLAAQTAGSFAQTPQRPRRIAILTPGTPAGYEGRLAAFRGELKRLGYVEGRDILFEQRYAEESTGALPALAAELVALAPAVILTNSSAGIAACKKATSTIPIVFASGGRPVEQGFIASLRRPGGNVTGIITYPEITGRIVQLGREALPGAGRFAMLVHEADPMHRSFIAQFEDATRQFGLEAMIVRVGDARGLERAFQEMVARKADLLYAPSLSFTTSHIREIVERSLTFRVPLVTPYIEGAATQGLLGYGTSREENFRRAATLVDKVLRGAKPGELPVEQPERFQLVVNLKTAKAIGVTVPQSTLLRATKVIE